MSLFERFLNKSNSYVYYKNNFEKLNASQKKIIKENNSLKASERKLKEENNYLKSILSENNKQIEELLIKLAIYSKQDIFNKLINNSYSELTICIKSPNPKKQRIWGDYFFALALKKSFEKHGFNVIIQEREDWYDSNVKPDINIVLRGLIEYKPNRDEINVMWNISHPDLVTDEEYESYDICFISSEKYANELNDKLNTPIKPLLQCTDPDVFYFSKQDDIAEDVLFVGITRGVYREIIKDMMKTDFDVSIYGTGWEQYVNEKYIKGQFIPNEKVHEYYSSCKILLNDHWEDMRDLDFPSNRLSALLLAIRRFGVLGITAAKGICSILSMSPGTMSCSLSLVGTSFKTMLIFFVSNCISLIFSRKEVASITVAVSIVSTSTTPSASIRDSIVRGMTEFAQSMSITS